MSVRLREVKNRKNPAGGRTGRSGTVYDVSRKYKADGEWKTYTKRGFLTSEDAKLHDQEMAVRFADPDYVHHTIQVASQPLGSYMGHWLEEVAQERVRDRTYAQYQSYINRHIIPHLGEVPLNQLTSAKIDDAYSVLLEEGCSDDTVQGIRTVLSSALAHAMKQEYVRKNAARNSSIPLVRNRKEFKTFHCGELRGLLHGVSGNWELLITLAGIYGMRINEVLGLRWENVDLYAGSFVVKEQLPFNTTDKDKLLANMAPTKSKPRTLPMTEQTSALLEEQAKIYRIRKQEGILDYDNDLVLCHIDGSPLRYRTVLLDYYGKLKENHLPQARLHDLRRSAATNMYQLGGDFLTISKILGHSISGTGRMLNLGDQIQCETDNYISSAADRKLPVLQRYHNEVVGGSCSS